MRFAELYKTLFLELMRSARTVGFACRGLSMAKELTHTTFTIEMPGYKKMSVFSNKDHRVVPIRFVLAELCHILAGRDDLESLLSYHAGMAKYSHDGVTLAGAYGKRLAAQLPRLIGRLEADPYTRQACAAIFNEDAAKNDSDKVRLISEKRLANDWSYSAEEKHLISNDLRAAASRFGKQQLKLDVQDQDPEVIVGKFMAQTGVSELTARYILAESGIQTEK